MSYRSEPRLHVQNDRPEHWPGTYADLPVRVDCVSVGPWKIFGQREKQSQGFSED